MDPERFAGLLPPSRSPPLWPGSPRPRLAAGGCFYDQEHQQVIRRLACGVGGGKAGAIVCPLVGGADDSRRFVAIISCLIRASSAVPEPRLASNQRRTPHCRSEYRWRHLPSRARRKARAAPPSAASAPPTFTARSNATIRPMAYSLAAIKPRPSALDAMLLRAAMGGHGNRKPHSSAGAYSSSCPARPAPASRRSRGC